MPYPLPQMFKLFLYWKASLLTLGLFPGVKRLDVCFYFAPDWPVNALPILELGLVCSASLILA